MPSFLKDLRSQLQVKRSSSLFTRKDTVAAMTKPLPAIDPQLQPTMGSDPNSYQTGAPSPDSASPPLSDVESDSGPSVGSGHRAVDGSAGELRLRQQPSNPLSNLYRMSQASTTAGTAASPKITDPLAPKVTNFREGAHCTQKLLLLNGRIGEESNSRLQGAVTVGYSNNNTFPPQTWPVVDSRFKALVMLQPGENKIRLDFSKKSSQSSLHGISSPRGVHTSYLNVVNVPKNHVPPLHLVILVAQDSPGTYDALPGEIQREGNGIDTAVRKFRMAGLLWQAFIAEQMRRHGYGMRTFRLDEDWSFGTVAAYDSSFTNEVRVHVVRINESVDDVRKLDYAQQYQEGKERGKLHSIAVEACRRHFNPPPGCPQYVAAMFLDTHWDPKAGVIRGHAALGAGSGDIRVGIFGSHALHAYPSNLASVLSAFNDATQTDTKYVANDVGLSGTHWEAACIGLAAHLHEVGHALGLPHDESGLMAADYGRFNRTFCVWEGYRSSSGERGQPILYEDQETAFHELSVLRLSTHPCLVKPGDIPLQADSVQVFALEETLHVTASSGIAWIEFYDGDQEPCKHYDNYVQRRIYQLELPRKLRSTLPAYLQQAKRLRLKICSKARGEAILDDFDKLFNDSSLRIGPKKVKAFRGHKVGSGSMQGSQPQEVVLQSVTDSKAVLNCITLYHGTAVDGIEFHYEGADSQLFGKRGGKPGGTRFELNARMGEQLHGFILRAGAWIDAIQIVTTHGRKSWMVGNARGGSLQLMAPPIGYSIAGMSGSCGAWLDSFQLLISR